MQVLLQMGKGIRLPFPVRCLICVWVFWSRTFISDLAANNAELPQAFQKDATPCIC
jgi:hypothetical protein